MDTVLAVPRSKRWTFDDDPSDYGSTCEWIFDRFDDVWGAWTIGLFIAPLVLAFFMGCCNVCRFSRLGYTLRLFLFSWVFWGCILFNAWFVPRSCPGLAFLDYPLDAFIIIATTLVSICLSWCEMLIFCADRGVLGYKDEPSRRAADAQDALIILQNLIASNNTSPPENSENNSEVDVQIKYRGWCSVRHTKLVGRHRPVTYRYLDTGRSDTRYEFRHEYETVSETLFRHDAFFKIARIEDASDPIPEIPEAVNQAFNINITSDYVPGDDQTEQQFESWKKEFERLFREKGERYRNDELKFYEFRNDSEIKNVPNRIQVTEEGEKPWYLNFCLVTMFGLLCLLWIWAIFVAVKIPDKKITIRKKFYGEPATEPTVTFQDF